MYVQVLISSTGERDLIWKSGLCRYNGVNMQPYSIRLGPIPVTGVLIRRGKCGHRVTQRNPGHNHPVGDTLPPTWQWRQQLEGSSCKPRNIRDSWCSPEAGRGQGRILSTGFRGNIALLVLHFRLPASRTMRG